MPKPNKYLNPPEADKTPKYLNDKLKYRRSFQLKAKIPKDIRHLIST